MGPLDREGTILILSGHMVRTNLAPPPERSRLRHQAYAGGGGAQPEGNGARGMGRSTDPPQFVEHRGQGGATPQYFTKDRGPWIAGPSQWATGRGFRSACPIQFAWSCFWRRDPIACYAELKSRGRRPVVFDECYNSGCAPPQCLIWVLGLGAWIQRLQTRPAAPGGWEYIFMMGGRIFLRGGSVRLEITPPWGSKPRAVPGPRGPAPPDEPGYA